MPFWIKERSRHPRSSRRIISCQTEGNCRARPETMEVSQNCWSGSKTVTEIGTIWAVRAMMEIVLANRTGPVREREYQTTAATKQPKQHRDCDPNPFAEESERKS